MSFYLQNELITVLAEWIGSRYH